MEKTSISKSVASYFLSWAGTRKQNTNAQLKTDNVNLLCIHQQFDTQTPTALKISFTSVKNISKSSAELR